MKADTTLKEMSTLKEVAKAGGVSYRTVFLHPTQRLHAVRPVLSLAQ